MGAFSTKTGRGRDVNRKVRSWRLTEEVACPECRHQFSLQEGISRHAMDRPGPQEFQTFTRCSGEVGVGKGIRATARRPENGACRIDEDWLEVSKAQVEKVRTDSARAAREALDTELKSTAGDQTGRRMNN